MEEVLNSVISTLDAIPVAGIENMRKMIGCVDALAFLANALHQPEASNKESKKEETDG